MAKTTDAAAAQFLIPLPGGRIAKVPLSVLETYAAEGLTLCHDPTAHHDDVTAHSMSVDVSTGASVWHTDWELGQCQYTDESGYPQQGYVWHRHPLGTEYTEIYQQ